MMSNRSLCTPTLLRQCCKLLRRSNSRNSSSSSTTTTTTNPTTPSPLQLYGFPMSQPTRSVIFLCEENAIPFELILVDARKGDTRKAAFKSLFPAMMVPALIDPAASTASAASATIDMNQQLQKPFHVEESVAILQYICEKYKLSSWYPLGASHSDVQARACVNFWLHWHHSNTRKSTRALLMPLFFPPKNGSVEQAMEQGRREFGRVVQYLENRLKAQPASQRFLCTNEAPTIADLLILPELDQISERGFGLFDYSPYPRVTEYIYHLSSGLKTYDNNFNAVAKEVTLYRNKIQK